MSRQLLLWLLCALITQQSFAGVMEIGATANYRKSIVNEDNFQEILSYTGSFSYYFWEMSALELSYTSGENRLITQIGTEPESRITTLFEMYGADLVLTLADKESTFQPYIKLGGAYLRKEIIREIVGVSVDKEESPAGLVPSAGVGFKIRLTKELSIKVGADAWSSPMDREPVTWDYAGRAGLSFMF